MCATDLLCAYPTAPAHGLTPMFVECAALTLMFSKIVDLQVFYNQSNACFSVCLLPHNLFFNLQVVLSDFCYTCSCSFLFIIVILIKHHHELCQTTAHPVNIQMPLYMRLIDS
eukprot:m.40511 g.40511  ORF g.40511 m.40511 type:complete len:113 (-) comp10443_c0_seq2:1356-1694(-)